MIRDPQTRQLMLRGASSGPNATECPYCHQPLRTPSADEGRSAPNRRQSFVSPEYFRMLHLASENESDDERDPPSSPIRRLTQPYIGNTSSRRASRSASRTCSERGSGVGLQGEEDVHVVTSTSLRTDRSGEVHGIKKEAFSPNYFEKFFTAEKELGRGGKGVVLLVRHELDGVFLGMPLVAMSVLQISCSHASHCDLCNG